MQLPSPNEDIFEAKRAPSALREAVEQLALDLHQEMPQMEGKTMGQIVQLAQEHHGESLPPFWVNWIDWAREEGPQPMGEL